MQVSESRTHLCGAARTAWVSKYRPCCLSLMCGVCRLSLDDALIGCEHGPSSCYTHPGALCELGCPEMRIIAGTHRGRRLQTLTGPATRPTTGQVKEALFNILRAQTANHDWLDLFAGSGAIGFEAASRGAKRVVLVESAAPAITIIAHNQTALGLQQVELFARDVTSALAWLDQHHQRFDVIFLDPPYETNPTPVLQAIASHPDLLRPGACVVLEHRSATVPPSDIVGLQHRRITRYGISALSFYHPTEA